MALAYMPKSKSDSWETPDIVFDIIKREFGIDKDMLFDPCPLNHKFDGLKINWHKWNFVNPPYSLLKEFVNKAMYESYFGNLSILLLPSKTDQPWFSSIWLMKKKIYWFKGRLKFKNAEHHATQPHFLIEI